MSKTIMAADLFCGAGGSSSGLQLACDEKQLTLNLLAVNHWQVAVLTHQKNHPTQKAICEEMDNVNPRKAIPGGYLDILVASPECTHHSNARGGKPMSDQSRSSAWHVLRWCEALRVKNILIENVPEFQNWGPLGVDNRPLKSKKGELFKAFINSLKALGYNVDYKVLNAANYGDPTTRKRLFILARLGKKVVWPEVTHTPDGMPTLNGPTNKWRTAREIIDWSISGKSIFERKKPLSDNTMRRIMAGLKKFSSPELEPFIVEYYGNGQARTVDKPLPTVTTKQRFGIVNPSIEPFVLRISQTGSLGLQVRSVDQPLPTIMTKQELALCVPYIVRTSHKEFDAARCSSVDKPLPTVIASKNDLGICTPFLVPNFGEGVGQSPRVHSIDEPLPTVTSHGAGALVVPEFDGYRLDIKFRMLNAGELARAMSFGDYVFEGNGTEVVKQIGNAVPVNTAKQLCLALLSD